MKTISLDELAGNATQLLELVENGETLEVLRQGKAVAQIVPMTAPKRIPAWKKPVPLITIPGASLSEIILEERANSL